VKVVRNDALSVDDALALKPDRIVISPGPDPRRGGDQPRARPPLAGAAPRGLSRPPGLGQAFGGKVVRAPKLMHGKTSEIRHDGKTIFAACPTSSPRRATTRW